MASLILGACSRKAVDDTLDATTGLGAVKSKIGADKELAKVECIELCRGILIGPADIGTPGIDLSTGPCLGNPMSGYPDWVCDVAHQPRQDIDDDPANQCSAFAQGTAKHYVELDGNCGFIKSE